VLPSFSCATVTFSAQLNITVCSRPSVVTLLHSVTNTISLCVAVLQFCHCYIQCPTKYHSLLPSFSSATAKFSAHHNIRVCCRPSVVPLLHSEPNTISQCVAALHLCNCYIQFPTQYHNVLPSFSCANVTYSAQHIMSVCCSPSLVPLLHSVPNTISQCVAVLQLCHCYIQCPTQYHSVLPSFSCATVTFSAQHNIAVCCRLSGVLLLHSVTNKISQCVAVVQL